jgi:hypothetical protein
MNREEADTAAAQLNAEHPERNQYRWLARRGEDDAWSVARVRLPHARSTAPPTASTQGKQPAPPPEEHPLELPGGMPNYGV